MKFRRIWKIFEIWKNYEFYEIWKISVILINLWDSTEFGNSLRTHRFTRSSLPNIMKQKLIQRLLRQVNSLEEDMQKILPPNCINQGTRCSLLLGVDQGWAWSIWARPFQILWWQVKRVTAWVTKKKKRKEKEGHRHGGKTFDLTKRYNHVCPHHACTLNGVQAIFVEMH